MNRNKGRRTTRKGKRDVDEVDKRSPDSVSRGAGTIDCHATEPNDWRWYAVNEGLLRDSASFPYGWPLGNEVDLGADGLSSQYLGGGFPGVMALEIMPTVGYSTNSNSPINVAARNIYSYVRHANSGHANYDSTDLMLYLIAMDSAYSMFSFMRRVYGVMRDYTATNRYYPKGLLRAMHVNFQSIQDNLAQLRYFINAYAVKIGSMCVPASMSYHARHMWMYDGLYVDSVSDKAQTYLYTPNGFYQFQLDSKGAGMLRYNQVHEYYDSATPGEMSFASMCTFANDIINPLLADEDMNIMSGDILKAYGAGGIVKIQGISTDYMVLPVYSEEVLDQIANSTAMGYPYTGTTLSDNDLVRPNCDIWQDTSSIPDSPNLRAMPSTQLGPLPTSTSIGKVIVGEWSHAAASDYVSPLQVVQRAMLPFTTKRIITFQHGNVEAKDTMVATRLTNMTPKYTGSISVNAPWPEMPITTVASEMVINYNMIKMTASGLLQSYVTSSALTAISQLTAVAGAGNPPNWSEYADVAVPNANYITENHLSSMMTSFGTILANFSVFDWHPILYPVLQSGCPYLEDGDTAGNQHYKVFKYTAFAPPVGDVNYYTTLDLHDLERLAETALLSEFSVPQAGFTLSRT